MYIEVKACRALKNLNDFLNSLFFKTILKNLAKNELQHCSSQQAKRQSS
jgi:hypothetical protein